MADRLLSLSSIPTARRLARLVGVPLPPTLERDPGPWRAQPLAGRSVDVLCGPGAALGGALAGILAQLGASVGVVGDPAPFAAAGEAWARPALPALARAPFAILVDATGVGTVADLGFLHAALAPRVGALQRSGRVIVLARPADSATDPSEAAARPSEAAARRALSGFTRSLARELGRSGATVNQVEIPIGAEDRLAGVLHFLVSPRSAYVSGQVWSLDARLPAAFSPVSPLSGRRVLVTGAARGIGEATARALAREGASVIVHDHPSAKEAAEALAVELGGVALCSDLSTPEGREAVLAAGELDVLVQNAGITRDKTLARMKPEHWSLVLAVNLEAVVDLAGRAALRPGGAMVCLSSIGGIGGNVGQTNYAATKAGVIGLVESLAGPLAARGVALSAVAPGFIETRMTAAVPLATREVARRLCNLSQGGLPGDVAELITFLASPGGRALSGRTLRVCGGNLLGA